MEPGPRKRIRLGEMFAEQSLITPAQLDHALKEQKRTGQIGRASCRERV